MAKENYSKKTELPEEALKQYFKELSESNLMWLKFGLEQIKKQTELLHPNEEQLLQNLMTNFAEECNINVVALTRKELNKILNILDDYTE